MVCASGLSRFQSEEHALSLACLSLQPFTGGMSSAEMLIISIYVNIYAVHQLGCTTREPFFHESYESWTCIYTVSLSDIHFTNCTTRKPLFHNPYESSRLKCSVTNDMHVTVDPTCTTRKPLFHDLYGSDGSYESCQAIHGSYPFDSIGQG